MRTGRAVWFAAARRVELREIEVREPGSGEVLIEAEVSGISAGTEMLVYRGLIPAAVQPDLPTVEGSFGFPIKFGYACVGRVREAGPDLVHWRGRRVFALHPHQTCFVAPGDLVLPLPDELPPESGVFVANLETALNVILDAHPRLGEAVVIFGQGIVGLLITALARRAGAAPVIAVDPVPGRRATAARLGAHLVLAPEEAGQERLRELTGGRGADLAIEASGSPQALQQALDAVAFQGTVIACAWYGSKLLSLDLGSRFHHQRLRLVSSQVSNLDPALAPRWDRRRRSDVALSLLPELGLDALVTHRFPLSRSSEAYRLLDETPGDALQVVLDYGAA